MCTPTPVPGPRYWLLFGLLFASLATSLAQRSLYDDVQLLRRIDSRPSPLIEFKFQEPDSVGKEIYFATGPADLPINSGKPVPIAYQGPLSMYFTNVEVGDSIIFILPDTTLRLAYPAGTDTLHPEYKPGTWLFNVANSEVEISVSGWSTQLYRKTIEGVYEQYVRAQTILFGSEIVKKLNKRQFDMTYKDIEGPLRRNPFMGSVLYGNRNGKMYNYYPPIWDALNDPEQYLNDFYQAYPYERMIAGDSLLDFRRNLSLLTTSSSYRSQIVTAQEQLQEASATVDANRRKSGGLSAQTVAVGLSDFIAERAQEELNLTFFNRFKQNLAEESELTILFPNTRDLMYKFEISNYKTFLNFARETFQNDLNNLSLNIPAILELPKYQRLQNDPNVFNLSLIYKVADLAYREVPVENILLASLQELQQRRDFLNQSINVSITDSTLQRSNSWKTFSPLASYRQNLLAYLDNLNSTTIYFEDALGMLRPSFEEEYNQWLLIKSNASNAGINDISQKEDVTSLDPFKTLLDLEGEYYSLYQYPSIGPVADLRPGRETSDTTTLSFTREYLMAKLEGRDYHLFRMEENRSSDFENYYLQDPISAEDNILIGLDASRAVLAQAYDSKFDRLLGLMDTVIRDYELLVTENRRQEGLTSEVVFTRVEAIYERHQGISSLINREIDFWKSVTGQDEQDHFIGGMAFLERQFHKRMGELQIGLLSGYYEVSARQDNYTEGTEAWEFNLFAMDSLQLVEANQKILGLHDAFDEYYQKYQLQRERMTEAFRPQFNNPAPRYSIVAETDSLNADVPMSIGAQLEIFRIELIDYDEMASLKFSVADEAGRMLEDEEMNDFKTIIQPSAIDRVYALHQQREALKKQLEQLERTYAGDLVDARRNAADMTTVFTMASQLVFALRTYEGQEAPLIYKDTQRVEIVRELPGGQMTKDSLIITDRVVENTGENRQSRWITKEEFDALRKDREAWNLYLGLLYQRLSTVEGGEQFSPEGVAILITKVFQLINEIDEQRDNFRRKKAAPDKSVTFKDYYPFIRSSVDLFNTVITAPFYVAKPDTLIQEADKKPNRKQSSQSTDQLAEGPAFISLEDRSDVLAMVPRISNEALSLYENIFVKNYGNAVLNATELMKILTGQSPLVEEDPTLALKLPGDRSKADRKQQISNARGISAVFRYGAFMASMLDAQTSDQVRNILRATTLPPGSSRIKREVLSNVTINSYLGAGLGRDRLVGAPTGIDPDAFGAALSVPIGLTYSFSPGFLRNNSSFSVHIPLLDLGAITAYRSNPGGSTANINNLPELEWKNLFSPGAYLIYNFAESPFSLGVGGQYGPQLREIVPQNGEPLFLNSWRFPMVMLSIDVPFYNLHTGARKIVVR